MFDFVTSRIEHGGSFLVNLMQVFEDAGQSRLSTFTEGA